MNTVLSDKKIKPLLNQLNYLKNLKHVNKIQPEQEKEMLSISLKLIDILMKERKQTKILNSVATTKA